MGRDPLRLSIYKARTFQKGFLLTGFAEPNDDADEADVYAHALSFLDRIIEEASRRGLALRDRLDAQGVLWCVVNWEPPKAWPETDQRDLLRYRGEEPPELPKNPQSTASSAAPMELLAERLLLDVEFLRETERLLADKRQMIFYGPPGTGKTFVALELAKLLAGDKGGRAEIVQFHPSYAYEDFVEGFRPTQTPAGQPGFTLKDGPLKRLALSAQAQQSDCTSWLSTRLIAETLRKSSASSIFCWSTATVRSTCSTPTRRFGSRAISGSSGQ